MTDVQRLERRKVRIAARGIAEQRRWRRVSFPCAGRLLLETGREVDCEILDISAGGVNARADVAPRVGSRIVLVAEHVGRIDLDVVRTVDSRFAGAARTTTRKRDRMADLLTWLSNQFSLGLEEDRKNRRITVHQTVQVVFADGVRAAAALIDASNSGASLRCEERVRLGEAITIDGFAAVVTRIHPDGFAAAYRDDAQEAAPSVAAGEPASPETSSASAAPKTDNEAPAIKEDGALASAPALGQAPDAESRD